MVFLNIEMMEQEVKPLLRDLNSESDFYKTKEQIDKFTGKWRQLLEESYEFKRFHFDLAHYRGRIQTILLLVQKRFALKILREFDNLILRFNKELKKAGIVKGRKPSDESIQTFITINEPYTQKMEHLKECIKILPTPELQIFKLMYDVKLCLKNMLNILQGNEIVYNISLLERNEEWYKTSKQDKSTLLAEFNAIDEKIETSNETMGPLPPLI